MANPTSTPAAAPPKPKLTLADAANKVRAAFPKETAGMTDYQVVQLVAEQNPDANAWGRIQGDWMSGLGKGLLEGSGVGALTGMDPMLPNEGMVGPTLGRIAGFAGPLLASGGASAALKLPMLAKLGVLGGTGAIMGGASDVASQAEQAQRGIVTENPQRRALTAALSGGVGAAIPGTMGSGMLSKMAYGAATGGPLGALGAVDDPEIGGAQGGVAGALFGGLIGGGLGIPDAMRSVRGRMAPRAATAANVPAAQVLAQPQRQAPGVSAAALSPLNPVQAPSGNPVSRALLHALLEERAPSTRPEDVLSRIDYLQDAIPVSMPKGDFTMAAKLRRPEDVKAMGGRYLMQDPEGGIVPMRQGDIRQGTKTRNIQGAGVEVPPGWDISFPTPMHQMGNEEFGVIGTQGKLRSQDLPNLRALLASGRSGQQAEMPGQDVPALVNWIKAQEAMNEANDLSRRSLAGGKAAVSGGATPAPLEQLNTMSELEQIVKEIRNHQLRSKQGRLF